MGRTGEDLSAQGLRHCDFERRRVQMRIVQVDDALKAVSIVRMFAHASEPTAGTLDLELLKLLREGGHVLRAELAEQLAHLTSGPPRTIRALAHDSYPEVAGPILQYSKAISDA